MWWSWWCLLLTALQYGKSSESLNGRGLSVSSVSLLNGLSAVQSHWSCQDSVWTHHCQGSRLAPLSELWSFVMSISTHTRYASYDMPATSSTCAWNVMQGHHLKLIMQHSTLWDSLKNCSSVHQQVSQSCFSGFTYLSTQVVNNRTEFMFATTFSYLFISYRLTVLIIEYENGYNNVLPILKVWASLPWSQPHIQLTWQLSHSWCWSASSKTKRPRLKVKECIHSTRLHPNGA